MGSGVIYTLGRLLPYDHGTAVSSPQNQFREQMGSNLIDKSMVEDILDLKRQTLKSAGKSLTGGPYPKGDVGGIGQITPRPVFAILPSGFASTGSGRDSIYATRASTSYGPLTISVPSLKTVYLSPPVARKSTIATV